MTKAPTTKAPAGKATTSAAKSAKTKASLDEAEAKTAKAAPKRAKPAAKDEAPPKGAEIQKPKAGDKPNALQQPLQPSPELAAIVGEGTMPRGQVVSKVWAYIREHNLKSPEDGRVILADDKLKKVFGKDQANMFEMNKFLSQHLKS